MLLTETIRTIENETIYVEDTDTYTGTGLHDWTTRVSKTFTLPAIALVGIKFEVAAQDTVGGNVYMGGRVLVDTIPVLTIHQSGSNIEGSVIKGLVLSLATGAHTIAFQTSCYTVGSGTSSSKMRNIYIGSFDLLDDSYSTVDSGNVNITTGTTGTLATLSPTVAATRKTVLGNIRKYTAIVFVYAELPGDRKTHVKNTGESNDSDRLNVKIFVDTVQKDWTERQNDTALDSTSNPTYGEGARGIYATQFAPGATPTIEVKVYNGFAADKTGRVNAGLIICPWFFGNENEPVDFDFPQGSTLYLVAEPLFLNPSKTIAIGKKRGISFGASNDNYSTSTGTDRISFTYTFEVVGVTTTTARLTGIGAALSHLGVDIR